MVPVKKLVEFIIKEWGTGNTIVQMDKTKPEAGLLYLDITKAKTRLGWKPKLNINTAIKYVVEWYKNYNKGDLYELCVGQIRKYGAEK